jgi:hypothetical protein
MFASHVLTRITTHEVLIPLEAIIMRPLIPHVKITSAHQGLFVPFMWSETLKGLKSKGVGVC